MTNNQPFTPYIIGIGPGDAAYIYPLAQQLIDQAPAWKRLPGNWRSWPGPGMKLW